jgi:predicted phage terminase large subunit-like protein
MTKKNKRSVKICASKKIEKQVVNQIDFRRELAKKSHYWFFNLYFSEYVKYETAPFQKELFLLSEDQNIKTAVVVAFRNSGKSTIFTLSYPIWSIIGEQQKKFVLILSQTQPQARLHLTNIKRELESNEILRKDLGPFREESDEWGSVSLVIPRFGARITCASSEQSVRGLRHGSHRPDAIIVDDAEDLLSTKTKESRDKTFAWFTGEILPAGDDNTKVIVVGNLLHEDSLLMKLRKCIEEKTLDGIFRAYPLVDDNNRILWPGKFPDMQAVETLRRRIANEASWQREFLLRIIVTQEQVIHKEWIQTYEKLPDIHGTEYRYTAIGVDLAIKDTEKSDYTAMVSARVYGYGDKMRIYILPNPVNEKLEFPETLKRAKLLSTAVSPDDCKATLFIEDVGYQSSLIQELNSQGYTAEGVSVAGQDKRARLALVSFLVQNSQVLFPKVGCEDLIKQLTAFGVEKHDDMADSFAILLLKIREKKDQMPVPLYMQCDSLYDRF